MGRGPPLIQCCLHYFATSVLHTEYVLLFLWEKKAIKKSGGSVAGGASQLRRQQQRPVGTWKGWRGGGRRVAETTPLTRTMEHACLRNNAEKKKMI
jgi:hypothetical protein